MIKYFFSIAAVFALVSCGGDSSNDQEGNNKKDSTENASSDTVGNQQMNGMPSSGDVPENVSTEASKIAGKICTCIGDSVTTQKMSTCVQQNVMGSSLLMKFQENKNRKGMQQFMMAFQGSLKQKCPDVAAKMQEMQRKQQQMKRQQMQQKMKQQQGQGGGQQQPAPQPGQGQ